MPVEVIRYERVPLPSELLVRHQKTTIPAEITYKEAIELWSLDREIIDTLGGQIEGISALMEEDE